MKPNECSDADLRFGIDYPNPTTPLYANLNASSGWCFHRAEPVRAIRLALNGRPQSSAIVGYPRLDIAAEHPSTPHCALLSGFHCHFNANELVIGQNRFVYSIELSRS